MVWGLVVVRWHIAETGLDLARARAGRGGVATSAAVGGATREAFGNALCGARLPIASIKIGIGQEASTRLSGKAERATSSSIGAERVWSSVSSVEASLEANCD